MVVPVGYEAFHSLRRKGVTFVCLLLAATLMSSTTIYVDSYSIYYWNDATNIGDFAISVHGDFLQGLEEEIREFDGVVASEILNRQYANLFKTVDEYSHGISGEVFFPSEAFLAAFPNVFQIIEGRFPQNESEIAIPLNQVNLWNWISGEIGEEFEYSTDYEGELVPLTVVGVFDTDERIDEMDAGWFFSSLIGILHPSLMGEYVYSEILVNVDRTGITPFNAASGRDYLINLDNQIRDANINCWVDNHLLRAVNGYLTWQLIARLGQIYRSGATVILILMILFLVIRFNVNERRYESDMLMARGASESDVNRIVNREIIVLSFVTCLVGLASGVIVSRFAMASSGYFVIDLSKMWSEPLLISLDSLVVSLIGGLLLPIAALLLYRKYYSTRRTLDRGRGRLAKIVHGFGVIKWDSLVVLVAGVLWISFQFGGQVVQSIPILSLVASIIPLPVFLGVASLVIKGLRRASSSMSRALKGPFGEVASSVGIRRIGKEASSAGPTIMVLVLAISIAWNSAVIDSTLPVTYKYHSQFALGADAVFHLHPSHEDSWQALLENVTAHPATENAIIVKEATLFLSDAWGSGVSLVGIEPEAYSKIGYDFRGNRMNQSDTLQDLQKLAQNPSGIIISSDIASDYEFSVGDTIRFFNFDTPPSIYEFVVLAVTEAIPGHLHRSIEYSSYWWEQHIGARRAWIHQSRVEELLNATGWANYYCLASAVPGGNTTQLGLDIIETGGGYALLNNEWGSVSIELAAYTGNTNYLMDRAVDTVSSILAIGAILGAFGIYAAEGIRTRRREIALLRSMGAQKTLVIETQGVELIVLTLIGLLLLLIYGPLYISNSLLGSVTSYSSWAHLFPIALFPTVPWLVVALVLAIFVSSMILFVLAVTVLSTRINIAASLNAAWAEAGPYGGDL
ncbi:MAG: ABC transporter permease [Candidatus Thorarchaeota archaeon]|nr:ABC transporter permease [Candidatus Thorarchaeota archaeon]